MIKCIDCDKELNTRCKHVKRCWDCHLIQRNINPEYNGNFKNKIFECNTCGKQLSHRGENIKNCYDCHLKLIKKSIGFCIDCQKILSKFQYKRCKKCDIKNKGKNKPKCINCSKLISHNATRCQPCNGRFNCGKKHYMFGKQMHGNYGYYNNTWMRSSWELNFAKWCDLSGIKWEYELKAFDLGDTTYTPDFYLPKFDLWIEVKGYWRNDAKKKFRKFKKLYKNINIEVFEKEKLKNYNII